MALKSAFPANMFEKKQIITVDTAKPTKFEAVGAHYKASLRGLDTDTERDLESIMIKATYDFISATFEEVFHAGDIGAKGYTNFETEKIDVYALTEDGHHRKEFSLEKIAPKEGPVFKSAFSLIENNDVLTRIDEGDEVLRYTHSGNIQKPKGNGGSSYRFVDARDSGSAKINAEYASSHIGSILGQIYKTNEDFPMLFIEVEGMMKKDNGGINTDIEEKILNKRVKAYISATKEQEGKYNCLLETPEMFYHKAPSRW